MWWFWWIRCPERRIAEVVQLVLDALEDVAASAPREFIWEKLVHELLVVHRRIVAWRRHALDSEVGVESAMVAALGSHVVVEMEAFVGDVRSSASAVEV